MSCHVRRHVERRPTSKSRQSRTYDNNALLLRCHPHPPKALCGATNFTLNTLCVSRSLSHVVLSTLLEMSAPWRSLSCGQTAIIMDMSRILTAPLILYKGLRTTCIHRTWRDIARRISATWTRKAGYSNRLYSRQFADKPNKLLTSAQFSQSHSKYDKATQWSGTITYGRKKYAVCAAT